jgi:hypothetical protein
MTKGFKNLVAARVLAIEAETGRRVLTSHTKRDLDAMLDYLNVMLLQSPTSLKVRVFKAIFEKCKGSHGLDVPIAAAEFLTACGIRKAELIRKACVWLEERGLIYRLAHRPRNTRFAILVPPEAA